MKSSSNRPMSCIIGVDFDLDRLMWTGRFRPGQADVDRLSCIIGVHGLLQRRGVHLWQSDRSLVLLIQDSFLMLDNLRMISDRHHQPLIQADACLERKNKMRR